MSEGQVVPILLRVGDLRSLGHTTSQEDGLCVFTVEGMMYSVERIFIRSIVQSLGYAVLDEKDSPVPGDIDIYTSLPWARYMALFNEPEAQR